MEYKELEQVIEGKGECRGFTFRQIKSNGYAYVYEVDNDGYIHYEVFERIINKQFMCVSYPKSNSFGIWAFCVHKLDKALQKYEELTEKVKNRLNNANNNN